VSDARSGGGSSSHGATFVNVSLVVLLVVLRRTGVTTANESGWGDPLPANELRTRLTLRSSDSAALSLSAAMYDCLEGGLFVDVAPVDLPVVGLEDGEEEYIDGTGRRSYKADDRLLSEAKKTVWVGGADRGMLGG
jgi:hypothetical protein